MNWIFRYLTSSIGKKHIMALSGFALMLFLIGHVLGNFLLFAGSDVFNKYSHALVSNPLIIPIEIGLLTVFLVHIFFAVWTSVENKTARPQQYAHPLCDDKQKLGSSFMLVTGVILIFFVIFHIVGIKFGTNYPTEVDGVAMRDLYTYVLEYFQSPAVVAAYTFSMVVLGVHLSHAFWSAFQTLGVNHKKYTPILKLLSILFSFAIAGGFLLCIVFAAWKGA